MCPAWDERCSVNRETQQCEPSTKVQVGRGGKSATEQTEGLDPKRGRTVQKTGGRSQEGWRKPQSLGNFAEEERPQ